MLAGTAILSKHEPLSVDKTLPGHPDPSSVKGRIVTLEFEHFYVVGTYVVNAGQGLKVCLSPRIPHPSTNCFAIDPGCKEIMEPSF
jgi:exonuclease III